MANNSQDARAATHDQVRESAKSCLSYFSRYSIGGGKVELADSDGFGLAEFASSAQELNLYFRCITLPQGEAYEFREPAITTRPDGCFAMLLKLGLDTATLVDPATEQLSVVPRSEILNERCAQIALFIGSKVDTFSNFRLSTIGGFIRERTLEFVALIATTFLINSFSLSVPLLFLLIIDTVIVGERTELLAVLAVSFMLIAALESALTIFRERQMRRANYGIGLGLYHRFVSHFLSLPLGFSAKRSMDAYFNVNELNRIGTITCNAVVFLAVDLLFLVVFLGLVFYFSLVLGVIMAVSLPLLFLGHYYFVPRFQKHLVHQLTARRKWNEGLIDNFTGIETIKSMSAENHAERLFLNEFSKLEDSKEIAARVESRSAAYHTMISRLTLAALLWAGAYSVAAGVLSLGQLVAIYLINVRLSRPVERLSRAVFDYQHLLAMIRSVARTVRAQPEVTKERKLAMSGIRGAVTFDNVCFRYESSGKDVLQNVSFDVRPGEVLGLIGPSGSGKTTIIKLVQGLYLADRGQIRIDGVDIRTIHPNWLRENFGTVEQECRLFRGSVADNIALGSLTKDMKSVIEAAKLAMAHDFIVELPNGYDTVIDRGHLLSGGQRQCLAVARAVFRGPRVLLLDEATSAMDHVTQAGLQANLKGFIENRTVIVVAHRLSALRHVDRIVTLEEGRVTQNGPPEELLEHEGYLAKMIEQMEVLRRFRLPAAKLERHRR
jgi:ATP-binding cassette, subfamily B, bacterial HlyB/CyaB